MSLVLNYAGKFYMSAGKPTHQRSAKAQRTSKDATAKAQRTSKDSKPESRDLRLASGSSSSSRSEKKEPPRGKTEDQKLHCQYCAIAGLMTYSYSEDEVRRLNPPIPGIFQELLLN